MKNIAKLTPELVIEAQIRLHNLNYMKYMAILVKHEYRIWCHETLVDWKQDHTLKFIKGMDTSKLREFYKDIINEINTQINPLDGNQDDEN